MKIKALFFLLMLSLLSSSLFGQSSIFKIEDNPYDDGTKILVSWNAEKVKELGNTIEIYKNDELVYSPKISSDQHIVNSLEANTEYVIKIKILNNSEVVLIEKQNIAPKVQYFNFKQMNVLITSIIYFGAILVLIQIARSGKKLFVRPIAGINAIDEAIGRATEMGKPILYVPGFSTISDVATIASLTILERVAKKAAQYDSKLLVPVGDPIVMSVAQEVVKEAHTSMGRPDSYNENNVFYITGDQFGFVAGVNGIMVREKPATNFFIGMFYAESLILSETGNSTGAIQIAGTDAVTQIPFFVTTCDYTLMGEELYAASAYLSNEPILLSTLKGQDFAKAMIIFFILIGTIFLSFGSDYIYKLFEIS